MSSSPENLAELAAEIERREAQERGAENRKEPRRQYRVPDGIQIRLPDRVVRVQPRDLSAHGMSFFHGGFIYPETPCVVMLKSRDGELVAVQGKTVRCTLVRGRIHDVGVKFDTDVHADDFVTDNAADDASPGAAGSSNTPAIAAIVRQLAALLAERQPLAKLQAEVVKLARLVGLSVASGAKPSPSTRPTTAGDARDNP